MDSDDISIETRFEKQVKFMKNHPDTLVLGGQVIRIDHDGNQLPYEWHIPKHIYRWDVLTTKLSVVHGCMMARRELMQAVGGYPENIENAVDRGLYLRMALYPRFNMMNLEDVLFKYRIHPMSTSQNKKSLQLENSRRVRKQSIEVVLGRIISEDEFRVIFEKKPGHVSPELSKQAYPMYLEFYKKFIKSRQELEQRRIEIFDKEWINFMEFLEQKKHEYEKDGRILNYDQVELLARNENKWIGDNDWKKIVKNGGFSKINGVLRKKALNFLFFKKKPKKKN